jgi:hypothetical protein
VPRRAEDGVRRLAIKPTQTNRVSQFVGGLRGGARRPVRTRLELRVVGVGRGQQPRPSRERRRLQAAVIPGTVEALVVEGGQ